MGKKKVVQKSEELTKEQSAEAASKQVSSKKSRAVERGRIYINSSYNNTTVAATDLQGNVLAWASAGSLGFSGPKKATPFAASKIVSVIAEKVKPFGFRDAEVFVKGVGSGRDSALRSLINRGFNIVVLKDVTPIPHNGPRPPKPRRV
ncbi:MAG: 30S ribosomal protein S11 [Candidatus Liptonbacteria bacterium]|nr:30S ribosomal protein S11 [Candidatus Liptonbacteria bacterium]